MNDIIQLTLIPLRKIFNKEDFYIYSCDTENEYVQKNNYGSISVKGNMPKLQLGREYKAQIELEKIDPKYGASYNVISVYEEIPDNRENQRHYLESLLTENQVKELFLHHRDENIVELFEQDKIDYANIKGFGQKTYQKVRNKILENMEHRDMFVHLGKFGINYEVIKRLIKTFGSSAIAISKINESPYNLTKVNGIGFYKADVIAKNMGIEKDDPHRINACIRHILSENEQKGNTYIEIEELIEFSSELLQLEKEKIKECLKREIDDVVLFDGRASSKIAYFSELNISNKMKEYEEKSKPIDIDIDEFIKEVEADSKHLFPNGLSDQQKQFIYNLCEKNVNILIGFGGTGKSSLQFIVKYLIAKLGMSVKWLSPTGKAAKVLSEYTGVQASTVHRAIGYKGSEDEDKDLNEITDDFIVVDEFSMVDVKLLSLLLNKIKNPQTRILFIGDSAQIASVSMGNILHDMVNSKKIRVTELTEVFRQSEGGLLDIITKIRLGKKFIDNDFQGKTLFGKNFILHCVDSEHLTSGYKYYYKYFLTKYKIDDILVVSPTRKGKTGTIAINKELQEINNPYKGQKEIETIDDCLLRVGDYVINTKNTYDILTADGKLADIVNGDMGYIVDIIDDWKDSDKWENNEPEVNLNGIHVNFGFETVIIPFDNKTQLLHGWCISMHRSQGSSAKAVISIVDKSNKFQINRNLLYTATSRCKEEEVLLSQADTINFALRKVENLKRKTLLFEFLMK